MDKDIERIYNLYKDDIFKYLISLTHDPNLSEDLLSETIIRAIKSIGKFKGESSLKTWLFSIARYTWYDYLRRDKKDISLHDLLYLHINEDMEMTTINRQIAHKIMELLKNENERNGDILLMKVKGYSYYEIGLKHEISESSARVIYHRLRNKIRTILEREGLGYE